MLKDDWSMGLRLQADFKLFTFLYEAPEHLL